MMTGAVGGSTLLAGCSGGGASQQGGTFIGVGGTPPTLDPRLNELVGYNQFAHNIFDTLMLPKPDGSGPVPHLAAENPQRKDETTFIFKLREGVKFHDGTELTAEDVAYSLEWILNPENKSPNRANLLFIDTVKAIDTYRVQFDLRYPYALFKQVLSSMNAPIVPKKAEKMGQKEFAQHPIGSGPFKFEELVPDSHLTLSRFDDYFLKTPKLAKVKQREIPKSQVGFVALASGDVHKASIPHTLLSKAKKQPNIEIKQLPSLDYNGLIMNGMHEPFRRRKIRKAMQYLANYDEMLKACKGTLGTRTYGFMPMPVNENWDFPWKEWKKKYYPSQDYEKAKQLIEEAGGIDKKIEISSLSSAQFKDMAVMFQRELTKVGVEASVREITTGQWLKELDTGNYDVTVYGWTGGADPNGFYYYFFRDMRNDKGGVPKDWNGDTSAGRLYKLAAETGKHKKKLAKSDRKIRKARKLQDQKKRRELYLDAATIWQGLYPHIPVYSEQTVTGWRKSVQDYEPSAFEVKSLCNEWSNVWLKGG